MAASVVLSYRRSDSTDSTGRINDHLDLYFGPNVIFRDIDSITVGDFPNQLNRALEQCVMILAVIGPTWINVSNEKGRRLDDPEDFVRQEISAGLARGIPIIPIIVSGGRMPTADELPEDLRGLERQQAFEIRSGRDFQRDVLVLCKRVEATTGLKGIDYVGLNQDCRALGLERAIRNFAEDRSVLTAIETARDLTVIMNDGRSWVDSNREIIQERIRDPDKETTFVLLHPKSPFIETLIDKNKKTSIRQREEIYHSFQIVNSSITVKSKARIFGHYWFNPSSLIMTEKEAFSSPYYFTESGALPMFKYHAAAMGGLYGRMREDALRLIANAVPLDADSFA